MAKKGESDPAFIRALEKRGRLEQAIREAQEEIKRAILEIKELDGFMRMHQRLLSDDEPTEEEPALPLKPVQAKAASISGYAGHGLAQEVFEKAARKVIAERGLPMESGEIVDELDKRGIPLGANPVKAAWNRLWQAKTNGILINIPRHGYWPADLPVPDPLPKPKRVERRVRVQRNTGRARGRQRRLSAEQIAWAREQLVYSDRTIKEICAELGGLATGTLLSYFGMSRSELQAEKSVESAENGQE